MKKCIALLLGLLFLTPVLGLAEGTDDASLLYVQNKGTLVVGFDPGFTPMSFMDEEGEYVGFDLELAYAVCDALGVELILRPIEWADKARELESTNIDCIWSGFAITPANEEFLFSIPYLESEIVVAVRQAEAYQAPADLGGARLGTRASAEAESALTTLNAMLQSPPTVVEYDMMKDLLNDLQSGALDAALLDALVANYYISAEDAGIRILEETLETERFGIAFRKEDVALKNAVDDALISLAFGEDGILSEISAEWFGDDVTFIAEYVAMAEEH